MSEDQINYGSLSDKEKIVKWLQTMKEQMLHVIWPTVKDPDLRDRMYGITGSLCNTIEMYVRQIESKQKRKSEGSSIKKEKD